MPFSPDTLVDKPYNRCVKCPNIGVRCDGPNPLAMTAERRIEWAKLRKEYKGFTNAYIAEKAGLAELTIARFFSGSMKDMRVSTLAEIYRVLVDGTWGQYPCAMDFENEMQNSSCADCKKVQDAIAAEQKKIEFLKQQITFKETQMTGKDKQLSERADFLRQKDRTIRLLASLLGISAALIFAALFIDVINPDIGFFWLEQMAALR